MSVNYEILDDVLTMVHRSARQVCDEAADMRYGDISEDELSDFCGVLQVAIEDFVKAKGELKQAEAVMGFKRFHKERGLEGLLKKAL